MNGQNTSQATVPESPATSRSTDLLGCVESDLAPIKAQLTALSEKYRNGGEDRIGWEILQSIRALDEATHLAGVYLSGTPLPTLAEMRGIFKHGHNPAHAIGTCGKCGEEMVYNVPRLGPDGGYVHKATGKLQCEQPNDQAEASGARGRPIANLDAPAALPPAHG